jgi:hypothetical protein
VRAWLRKAWWPVHPEENWWPTKADVEAKNREFDSLTLLKRLRWVGHGRPLFKWDRVAFYLWIVEFLIVLIIKAALAQGWGWSKLFL